MSSGIHTIYTISSSDPDVPVSYKIGLGWASGETDHLMVFRVRGLAAVRTAYAHLPGLGGYRSLWVTVPLSGAAKIADDAARIRLDNWARAYGHPSPLLHGFSHGHMSVSEYLTCTGFTCGAEILAHAKISPHTPFLDAWEALAIAAEEWPRERWGGSPPKVQHLTVRREGGGMASDKTREKVLYAAARWSSAYDAAGICHRAERELAPLLKEI